MSQENCSYYSSDLCRSCDLLPMGLASSAVYKEEKAFSLLDSYLRDASLSPIATTHAPFQSRAKGKIAVSGSIEDPCFGFFSTSQEMHPIESCPLHLPVINEIIALFKTLVPREHLAPYDLASKRGELKGLLIASTHDEKSVMLRIVLRSRALEEKFKKLVPEIQSTLPIKVISLSIQPHHQANLEGETEIIISDEKFIWESYSGIQVALAPKSFFQVTPEVASKLYATAGNWIKESTCKNLLELYCGAGAFSLTAASTCESCFGIDITNEAVEAARISAVKNKLTHVAFAAHDLEDPVIQNPLISYDATIVNPPRRGLSIQVISLLLAQVPDLIIYSSCNPLTLARDLKDLSVDYKVQKAQCFDMFPLTSHVETLCLLKRRV